MVSVWLKYWGEGRYGSIIGTPKGTNSVICHDSLKEYPKARAHSDCILNLSIIDTMYLEKVMSLWGLTQHRGRFGCAKAALPVIDSIFYISR